MLGWVLPSLAAASPVPTDAALLHAGPVETAALSKCFPPENTVWLFAVHHKTGTVFSQSLALKLAGGWKKSDQTLGTAPYAFGWTEHMALAGPKLPNDGYHPHERECLEDEEVMISASCTKAMQASGSHSMVATCSELPSNASALDASFTKVAAETGTATRLLHFVRDPAEVIISAYHYHRAASESWCIELPNKIVGHLVDTCRAQKAGSVLSDVDGYGQPWPYPDAAACGAVLEWIRGKDQDAVTYTDVLLGVDWKNGTLIQAWQHYPQQRRMVVAYSAIEDLRSSNYPSATQAININLNTVMDTCTEGFKPVMRAAGLEGGSTHDACLQVFCETIKEGESSSHSTTSDHFQGSADEIAAVKAEQRTWLPSTGWFMRFQQPLRRKMGLASQPGGRQTRMME